MNRRGIGTRAACAAVLVAGLAAAQSTSLVSVSSLGVQASGTCYAPAISADGRFVAFESISSNLVPGDTNGFLDVFVHDRLTGATTRVSVSTGGAQGNQHSYSCAISGDGRIVVFKSAATNLAGTDTNLSTDIFAHDRLTGTTTRVSVDSGGAQADSGSELPAVSADGRWVSFDSEATNLVPGDTNGQADIFVHDLQTGATTRVSVATGGAQGDDGVYGSSLSADGRYVAFGGYATNLVANDTNAQIDAFVHDRLTGTTTRVSVDSGGLQGNGYSFYPVLSADGRVLSFLSSANNLVPGDFNGQDDVFVHDRLTGITTRASVDSLGFEGNGYCDTPSISGDGRFVVFFSEASNLAGSDGNSMPDVFLHDRLSATTELVSVAMAGGSGNSDSGVPTVSADGRYVAFDSDASDLVAVDGNGTYDAFVRDRRVSSGPSAFCLGDGSAGACPCGNNGATGKGCENSAGTGGAQLTATGSASLLGDTLVLTSSGELPGVLSIFLQGDASITPVNFGDGLRCTGGILHRLYITNSGSGTVSAPQAGDLSVSAASAALGDTIAAGTTRHYQTYYRDPLLSFCPNPPGDSWNVTSGLSVTWDP
jgi:Tol biopolymer transport system component